MNKTLSDLTERIAAALWYQYRMGKYNYETRTFEAYKQEYPNHAKYFQDIARGLVTWEGMITDGD
jgi:hypothetical protein